MWDHTAKKVPFNICLCCVRNSFWFRFFNSIWILFISIGTVSLLSIWIEEQAAMTNIKYISNTDHGIVSKSSSKLLFRYIICINMWNTSVTFERKRKQIQWKWFSYIQNTETHTSAQFYCQKLFPHTGTLSVQAIILRKIYFHLTFEWMKKSTNTLKPIHPHNHTNGKNGIQNKCAPKREHCGNRASQCYQFVSTFEWFFQIQHQLRHNSQRIRIEWLASCAFV